MNKKMKTGILQSLSRTEMKKVLGGLIPGDDGVKCADYKCDLDANGVRKKCPKGCQCESSEERPCY